MTAVAVVVLSGTAGAATPSESAQSPEEQAAARIFQEGYAHFNAGRFEQALASFQLSRELVDNVFIQFYLGRTYTALNRCAEAIPLLTGLRGRMGNSPEAREADKLRAGDEAACRLSLGSEQLEVFLCPRAVDLLTGLDTADLAPRDRRLANEKRERAQQCVEDFGSAGAASVEAAKRHAEARGHLDAKRFAEALAAAERSIAVRQSAPARLVRALAMAGLGRCRDALPLLASLTDGVTAGDRGTLARALDGCRLAEARRLVGEKNCPQALPLLEVLAGRVRGADERWRAEQAAWCRPRATEFLTDTAQRKAAYDLFVAARKARDAGKLAVAVERFEKALRVADEPIIRRELAAAHIAGGACERARAALAAIPRPERTQADRARLKACGTWAPHEALSISDLGRYVDAIERADRSAEAGGGPDAAIAALDDAWKLGGNPAVRAAAIDLLYDADRCGSYVAALADASPEVRAAVRDRDARTAACSPDSGSSVVRRDPAPAEVASTLPAEAAIDVRAKAAKRPRRVWGWVLGGVAVAAAGAVTAILLTRRTSGDDSMPTDFTWDVP